MTPDEVQEWMLTNEDFDWEQDEPEAVVSIAGRGVQDADGNLYFAGSKTLDNSNFDLLNIFVARINADGTLGWTKEWGTDQADAATSIAVINETDTVTSTTKEYLYVPGYTWGHLDEGGHALNGFGQYGGRDVVLAKVTLSGDKIWMRQFGSTANDFAYGVGLDDSFNTLLLSGGCATNQVDETVEVDVAAILETRRNAGMISDYEPQIMDPKARTSPHNREYDFAVSLNFDGDILDYAMDGGVTITPRRRRIREGGLVAEYVVVLNRQPLADVVVQAQDVRLLDPSGTPVQQLQYLTPQRVVFTRANWNREQLIRLKAVDDNLAEGRHYAVVTHSVTSTDPNFDGAGTPFLAGRNVTIQIDDNDLAGISLSRRHVFIAEGGGNDSYKVVLTSRPWHPVKVVIKPLHANQTTATPAVLNFEPEAWDKPQQVLVSAVDDVDSEVEYGGLYTGGPLLHYSESRDIRYHTRRPQCFDVPNCDPSDASLCLLPQNELQTGQTSIRVCDITSECTFAQGNGACIANVVNGNGTIPARFGNPHLNPNNGVGVSEDMSYEALVTVLAAEKRDSNLTTLSDQNISILEFAPPPPDLRGFVLSFLGLMNVGQARKMSANPRNVQHTVCAGLVRLETMRWVFEEWPKGYVDRVLAATFAMFPQSYSLERHSWNCGMANFLPNNEIAVSIWDNDPGVTLSTTTLEVTEGDNMGATYDVVLNAPPSIGGLATVIDCDDETRTSSVYCTKKQSDKCGFWGENFSTLAATIYDQSAWRTKNGVEQPNISIAIVGNSQVTISPSLLTFTATNWFVPQRVTVRAVDDSVSELNVSYTLSHRIQNSVYGYTNQTAFWFRKTNTLATAFHTSWKTEGGSIPYNSLPTVLHSPDHVLVNVFVRDNDVAQVDVVVSQPKSKLVTKEASDAINWVGDYVTALAFHDVSVSKATKTVESLKNILVFASEVKTFMKFHLPRLHDGDTSLRYSGATLLLHQTPYKVFNVSEMNSDNSTGSGSSTGAASFTKEYLLKVTAVDNAWTTETIRSGAATPQPLSFVANRAAIKVLAKVEKSRSIEVDISPLVERILPTRLSALSLQIEVLSEGGTTDSIATTQLCSSVFERKLRPLLSLSYEFPNLLRGLTSAQSSTAISAITNQPLEASIATNGAKYDDSITSTAPVATTTNESDPWWEVTIPQLTKLGTVAIFLPASVVEGNSRGFNLVVIASLKAFDSKALTLSEALSYGCPSACPHAERFPVRKGILLWEVQAGAVAVRIYREGIGILRLAQVQAFESFISVTTTADGTGIRSRLKSDWGPSPALLQSWHLLQTVRRSETENLAVGMATRQSSTNPHHALSHLAVDGLRHSIWDPLILQREDDSSMAAASTRAEGMDPWWEVDLGSINPIQAVVLYPYVGSNYDELCAPTSTGKNGYPEWSGDLFDFSHMDSLLQLKAPFAQQFDVLLSDQPLTKSDGTASGAAVTASKTLTFSCANYTNSIMWGNVFSNARFVTVRKRGAGVLMLNEVEVLRWNPATLSRYLLLDLFGTGGKPLALSSVQLFPPSDVAPTDSETLTVPAPLTYKIHSVSSQFATTGAGSASSLLDVKDNTVCYVASTPSYHEWVVLELDWPVQIGLVDVNTNVSQCSTANVEAVTEFSVASHGSVLDNIRSEDASEALTADGTSTICQLSAAGLVTSPSSQCSDYVCTDAECQSPVRAKSSAGSSLVLSDFVDLVALGKPQLLPLDRLPLSVNENRALLLRDTPVVIWPFDDAPKVLVSNDEGEASWGGNSRATGALELKTSSSWVDLESDDNMEGTFFSAAVALQPAMSSFSLEFWFLPKGSLPVNVVSMYGKDATGNQVKFGNVGVSSRTGRFYFEMTNPDDRMVCRTDLGADSIVLPFAETWHQVVAIYDPSSSSISLSICVSGGLQIANCYTNTTLCSMALLSLKQKKFRLGAADSDVGFVGMIASASWFVRALTGTEIMDHYHDFLDGVSTEATAAHNTYSIQLSARPLQPVTVKISAESACYRFNLCNISVVPSMLKFTTEKWKFPRLVHVLATDDQLFEGLHYSDIFHAASSPPLYQLTSIASTSSVNSITDAEELLQNLTKSVTEFYRDLVVRKVFGNSSEQLLRQDALMELHRSWAKQIVHNVAVAANAYAETIPIMSLMVSIADLTVPGIEFSTASLSVSEDGKGNDYQVVLLSEPTEEVRVKLHVASGCYRRCVGEPLCPSRSVEQTDGKYAASGEDSFLTCGGDTESMSTSTLLCNITLSPDILIFSTSDWSLPKTVRVLAVDDHLDEQDVHVTIIRASSESLDPIYDSLVLPDVVVAIADNDKTNIFYSSNLVSLSEKPLAVSTLKYPHADYYTLQLLTEPYANVTIAMSNEANKSCYRRCGSPFDETSCGLPRQQSVSLVHLRTNSTREIHQISLRMTKTTEVQRIVTFASHVDQIFQLSVSGGFGLEIQTLVFTFNAAFKSRFASADAVTAATNYGGTFTISNGGASTSALDLFSTAVQVQAAINGLFGGANAVSVTRDIQYAASTLTWCVTFLRFVTSDGAFPLLSVAVNGAIQGELTCQRKRASSFPTGTLRLGYGSATFQVPILPTASALQTTLSSQSGIYSVSVSRRLLSIGGYGLEYIVTFMSVETFSNLVVVSVSSVVASVDATTQLATAVNMTQSPMLIGGSFVIDFFTPLNLTSAKPNRTAPIFWNDSAEALASKLVQLQGIANVTVSRQKLSAEGGMAWTVQFLENYGNIPSMIATSLNLTGKGVTVGVNTIRDGESLRGNFSVQMGGWFKKTDPRTNRAYMMNIPVKNTTLLPFNSPAWRLKKALFALNVTEVTNVTRTGVDCDIFDVCYGYTWTVSYLNSPGNVPPIAAFPDEIMRQASGMTMTSSTIANGTYLGGSFTLRLELFDPETNQTYVGTTWRLPVNVSAVGMDEALEALPFVRSNREAEYDPETKIWRGIKFDKGVRVYREGPYLDGGHTWRLEWALEDYLRFADLKITMDVSLVTQEIKPLPVPSELDLKGKPRCSAIPRAQFQPDVTDPLGLRGFCVYAIANETAQERFLCNFTVLNPWIVFTPENWCIPQQVQLEAVDDYIDESTKANGLVTFSKVTHTVFSDDYIYLALPLPKVAVQVESDDVAKVLVSETALQVSEDGIQTAQYYLQLNSEPLADVKIVVLPWLDGNNTQCYRFGLCNITLPVSEFVFTPRKWNVPQKVAVLATDDSLDEYDTHLTGISHVSYSDDPKYNEIPTIPKVNVTVLDNDVSGFTVDKASVFVTEGLLGAVDFYTVVLTSEPFAKVTVAITNVGIVGDFAVPSPTKLVFSWRNWNIPQTVNVTAFDDRTQDVAGSTSSLNHSLTTNDIIYAGLKNLASVKVFITDNDKSGIELSTRELRAVESNNTVLWYSVRLTSEPWEPVVVQPNASHDCYLRVQSSERVCNISLLTTELYFGASNWSKWQNVSLIAVDDWLDEGNVHTARISHSSSSSDPLYSADYATSEDVKLFITDNDVSFVNITLRSATKQLHAAEGSFNDSYSIFLNSEPYEYVTVTLRPTIEKFVSLDTKSVFTQPQVGISFGSSSSSGMTLLSTETIRSVPLIFTPLDWSRPRIVTVFAIDDAIPEPATQYSTVLHSVSSADSGYNISNSSIGVVSVSVMVNDREAIPPPLPLSAMLDNSGSKINIAFDSTVYHAASMDVSSSGSYVIRVKTFPCSLVFNFAAVKYTLGSQAQCLWVDMKNLRIELSAGATITARDKLILNDCSSFADQYCNATNVLRAGPSSRAFSQASVLLQVPTSIVQPNPVLLVPESAGSCGSWSVDASLSTGAGGRPFAHLLWFALPVSAFPSSIDNASPEAGLALYQRLDFGLNLLCQKHKTDWTTGVSSIPVVPAADVALAMAANSNATSDFSTLSTMAQLRSTCYLRSITHNATTASALIVQVNGSLLEPGAGYRIGLKLVNAFAQSTVVSKAVNVQGLPGPAVFIVGESTQTVTRVGAPIVLQVDSTVSCPTLSSLDVAYRWTVTSKRSESGAVTTEDFNKENSARDPRVFRLPRPSLQAGLTYTFRAEAYMKGASASQASSSFASIVVFVASSLPQVSIKGGDCALGERDTLVLDGSTTSDPDASSSPFTYLWTCQDVTNSSTVGSCMNASVCPSVPLALTSTKSVLRIAPLNLASNRQLKFSLTASKGSRTATAFSTIWTVAGRLPVVLVTASATKMNPSSRLTLTSTVTSDYPYTTRWTQTIGDLELPRADVSDMFTLPLTSTNNAIRSFKLAAGLTYNFRLVATDTVGNVGFGSVSVVVNSPPASGTFVVSPQSGYAMQDTFTLTCSLWSDDADDFPLTYSFGVLSTAHFEMIEENSTDSNTLMAQLRKSMTPIVVNQLTPLATAKMFAPEDMADSESVTVLAFISDRLGAVALAYDTIKVLLPEAAKSSPVLYVSDMFDANGALKSSAGKSQDVRQVLAGALLMEKALGSSVKSRRLASCPGGYMGDDCATEIAVVQRVNAAILATVSNAVGSVEPSSSGLSQQARVLGSVMRAAPQVLTEAQIGLVTELCSGIAGSALTLDVPDEFLDTTSATLLEVISLLLRLESSSTEVTSRRLVESDAANSTCIDTTSAGEKSNWDNMVRTLQSLAVLSSDDLLVDEPPAVLEGGDVRTYSAKGSSFRDQVSMTLTSTAVACLGSDLYLNALSLVNTPHSACTLNGSEPVSRRTLFSVHSQAAVEKAARVTTYASNTGVQMQTLPSTSACVKAASESTRRLESDATEAEQWMPLAALTIPHERELSAIERSNFSTSCRTWSAEASSWSVDVCFKDDSASTSEFTVCYCTQIESSLEILVTLDERLDFYALHRDLYRNDEPSLVVSATLAVLVGVFVMVAKLGQRLDARDIKRDKQLTIKRLNRAKWSELEARMQVNNVFEDFDAHYVAQQQQKRLETRPSEASTAVTDVGESSALFASSVRGVHVNGIAIEPLNEPLDTNIQLPDEARTLFGSSTLVDRQYRRVTFLFRFVLGRTPAELVLYLYGGPLGFTLMIGGAVLIASGIAGVLLARRDASNAARTAYLTALGLGLLAQFLVVMFAFHLLSNFDAMPHGVALALRSKWDALSVDSQTQLQVSYACCGFLSINEEESCPEEALDAVASRTCSVVLGAQASTLFSSSFKYVEIVLVVEIACVALANFLVRWRRIRLVQLASSNSADSAEATIVRSLVSAALLCSLPPLYALLACAAVGGVLFGVDLMLHWGALEDPLVSALFGVETGVFILAGAVVYLVITLWALRALGRRDVRALRWVLGSSLVFLLLNLAVRAYIGRLLADFYLDPSILEAIEAKYVKLSHSALLDLEMELECCGFTSGAQGACVEGSSDADIPICREQVESALTRSLALATDRLAGFLLAQTVVFVLLAWLCFRLRRFSSVAAIRSTPVGEAACDPPTLSQKVCASGLLVLNLGAVAAGVGILCLGIDVLFELNVLQMSYLLRVYDRRLGVYLLFFGGTMEIFALLGGIVAWLGAQGTNTQPSRMRWTRKWLAICYSLACAVLFVAAFIFAGVRHKLSSQYTPITDATVETEAIDTRMTDLWISAPSNTKLFVQNSLQCCGYERIEAANGSVSYTLQVEKFGWRRLASTATYQVYSSRNALDSRKTRILTDTKAESTRLSSHQCPTNASDGCAAPMKQYVSRVARSAWQLCAGVAGFTVTALVCACGLQDTNQRERNWNPHWRLRVKRTVFLVLVLAGILSTLACFILGLDVAVGWTLFSSSAFQMVFARSMGASLMVYGVLAVCTQVYSSRAALHFSVHQLFLQCATRIVLASALFAAVGLTAHLSHYSSLSEESWHAQLESFLDGQWSLLTPVTQNTIALEFSCCGFNDPVLVPGQGVVFDRPALGYPACSLSISRGCKGPLMTGVESSFAWLFAFLLALALLEIACMVLGALVLHDVRNYEAEAWFHLESRLRYVAGRFRRDFRQQHVLISVGARFDPRLTRTQRAVSVLCAWAASLAVYAGYFATKGCYRTSLKSCEQPGVGELIGLGLVYGGAVGLAVQTCAVALFEHVRHRADDETKEVATARQRKEKVLLFRRPWFRRRRPEDQELSKTTEQSALTHDASTLEGTQTTTEERWFVWLTRFVALVFQTCGVALFLGGCALATLLGLLRLGYNNSLYGVPLDEDVFELLAVAGALIVVALVAALANDLRDQHLKRSNRRKATPVIVALVIVAIIAVLALIAGLLAVFMIHEVVQDDANALNSWSVRTTGFSVVERLETAWKEELTGYARDSVQQELRCCGFWSATDAPFLPCPHGDPVEVTYEALSVSGAIVTETKHEFTTLPGCRAGMLARFHNGADVATYCALAAAGLLILTVVTSLFLTHELAISKDAKLKLRVPDTEDEVKRDVRETFETVVGLKIAAPARGKLRSQILASSLDSVSPSVASELAAVPLKHEEMVISSTPAGQEDFVAAKIEPSVDVGEDSSTVPYPAWIVYVVFAMCLAWLATMAYLVAISAMELGLATSWRCVLAWATGVAIQELIVEPIVILASIVARTLRDWWSHTLVARVIRRGRALLRIGPQDAEALEREQLGDSLTLYDRLRYAAAVRIQRRLLTRVTRARYLRQLRAHKQDQHRLLAVQRRDTLRKTIHNFSEEEIEAFRLLFAAADAAQLGLVSHTAIAQAVYELGVHVPAPKVRELLEAFDPAYADLVDFEHFLYGMHCVRLYHQQLQTPPTEATEQPAKAKAKDEKLVSSSDRFGPRADPRAELLVKRQNLLRELRDRRESLAHKLMRKVSGRLPALAHRGKSVRTASIEEGDEALSEEKEEAAASENSVPPTGTYVFWQNRKLSPKKRALESALKKKHQERIRQHKADNDDVHTTARAAVTLDAPPEPKTSAKQALKSLASKKITASRGSTAEAKSDTATTPSQPRTELPTPAVVAGSSSEGEAKLSVETLSKGTEDKEKVTPVDLEPSSSGDESRAATAASDCPAETKSSEPVVKSEEAKPFGAYMLLTKQPPPLRPQKVPTRHTDEPGADSDAVSRPTTAEKTKTDAQSALEKALLKKQKAKSKPKL
ncbi:REJ domain-containing protein [Phytophthora infestans]|uniref:REJ domain-containing protein n=2 Tax=Phytophthora infestans TaxID=4787 RepID=A0A8S9UAY5_PHYIN|nr:REJ domain-containing protein [Phytophthora infestans]